MKSLNTLFATALLFGTLPFSIRAGSVLMLANGSEVNGKVSLSVSGVHVEGGSPSDIPWPDLLEADFSDEPFQLQYFRSEGETGKKPPAGWTTKAIGSPDPGGAATYADGTLTLKGDGSGLQDKEFDHYYFAGLPWSGDGQWTCYIGDASAEAGFTLRKSLEAGSPMFAVGVNGFVHQGAGYSGFSGVSPTWLRWTKLGNSLDTSISADGKTWQVAAQNVFDFTNGWFGFILNSRKLNTLGTAVVSHITMAPAPPQPETVPPGVLLKDGSYLAGTNFYFSDTDGAITHDNKGIPVKTDQVSAVLYHSVTLAEIAHVPGPPGMMLRNGDFLSSNIQLLQGGLAQVVSIELGMVGYFTDLVRGYVANPLSPLPSDYEIRLRDGSTIRAKGFSLANNQLTIQEIGGLSIIVDPAEVLQVRAGTARLQPLISLPWKSADGSPATASLTPSKPPIPSAAASTPNAPPATEVSGAADPASPPAASPNPSVLMWSGPNHEQILALSAGAPITFPLKGKFRALAMRVAVAPGALDNAQATLRVQAGGQEVTTTPAFKSGDQPHMLWLPLANPSSVTLEVESLSPGTRLMLIDPVAIRD